MKDTVMKLESQVYEHKAQLTKLKDKHKQLQAMLEQGMHNSKSATQYRTLETIKEYVESIFNL